MAEESVVLVASRQVSHRYPDATTNSGIFYRQVSARRWFGAQTLPSWPDKDKRKWTSLLPSSKAATDLTVMETHLSQQGVKYWYAREVCFLSLMSTWLACSLPAFVDMHGVPKTKLVPVDHVVSMCEGSELFTGAALDGVPQEVSDNEVCAVADAALGGFVLPYKREVAWFPASLYLDGKPFEACSRNIYARAAAAAKEYGYLMKLGIEAEFFVFREEQGIPRAEFDHQSVFQLFLNDLQAAQRHRQI